MPTGLLSHSITRGGRTQSWSQSLKSSTKTTNLALHYYSLLCTDEKPTANCNCRLVAAIPQIPYPTRSSVQLGYQGGIESWIARAEWNANFGRSSIDPGDSKHMVIVASGLRKYKCFFEIALHSNLSVAVCATTNLFLSNAGTSSSKRLNAFKQNSRGSFSFRFSRNGYKKNA